VQKQIPWASPQQVEQTRELQARQILELDPHQQILALFTSVSDLLLQEQVQVLSVTETFFVAAPYLLNNKTYVPETVFTVPRNPFFLLLLMQNLLKIYSYVI
jgi:hypothetical protein